MAKEFDRREFLNAMAATVAGAAAADARPSGAAPPRAHESEAEVPDTLDLADRARLAVAVQLHAHALPARQVVAGVPPFRFAFGLLSGRRVNVRVGGPIDLSHDALSFLRTAGAASPGSQDGLSGTRPKDSAGGTVYSVGRGEQGLLVIRPRPAGLVARQRFLR